MKAYSFAIRCNYLPIFTPQAERGYPDQTDLLNKFVGGWKEVMQKQMIPIISLN
jgi:hypothetical protein